ncbi:MAG: AAA family ATPase, partial [Chloroflexota bacterium]|nr:AAA family ATPase [Chloroflexota bacterium]
MAYISRLSLTNFRNLVELELDLPPAVSVFYGANAQGQTTLLEAIYLLAIARSYRAENEREVVNFQSATEGGQALVGGIVEKEG